MTIQEQWLQKTFWQNAQFATSIYVIAAIAGGTISFVSTRVGHPIVAVEMPPQTMLLPDKPTVEIPGQNPPVLPILPKVPLFQLMSPSFGEPSAVAILMIRAQLRQQVIKDQISFEVLKNNVKDWVGTQEALKIVDSLIQLARAQLDEVRPDGLIAQRVAGLEDLYQRLSKVDPDNQEAMVKSSRDLQSFRQELVRNYTETAELIRTLESRRQSIAEARASDIRGIALDVLDAITRYESALQARRAIGDGIIVDLVPSANVQ
jgi:hypothetical protein